jgi:hypothetical protein
MVRRYLIQRFQAEAVCSRQDLLCLYRVPVLVGLVAHAGHSTDLHWQSEPKRLMLREQQ